LRHFAEVGELQVAKRGEEIFHEGDVARHIFILVEGECGVFKDDVDREVMITALMPGDFFGEMSFIDMQPRAGTVRALRDCVLWRWSYASLRDIYRDHPKAYTLLVMNIAREMSRRLRRADRDIMARA